MFEGTNGYADGVPVEKMAQWQSDLLRFMESSFPEIGKNISEKKMITDDNRVNLTKALDAFRSGWQA